MKKIIVLALLTMIMVGCEDSNSINTSNSFYYNTVIIDSCEYVEGYYRLAHKGNCRFCAERNKRMVREQVDSILTQIFD